VVGLAEVGGRAGTLLADGIGDTIRISLSTFHAEEEVKVAWEILKALRLRERGPVLIACPTCGRLQFDMDTVVAEVEKRLEAYEDPIEVSVLGCAVNGIGNRSATLGQSTTFHHASM
jgi:(E)-4-hydroxy-3-methylbut-2-enyl-diphosphate synthase